MTALLEAIQTLRSAWQMLRYAVFRSSMDEDTLTYFGYGSNMLTRWLQARTPSARFVARGHVTGRRLTFHKMSDDDSGKGDAELTNNPEDRVEGVLFKIMRAEKAALDEAEGLNRGYEEIEIEVITAHGPEKAVAYVATAKDATRVFPTTGTRRSSLPARSNND
jgi:cation transport regulator ChaC